mgnify:FL=1
MRLICKSPLRAKLILGYAKHLSILTYVSSEIDRCLKDKTSAIGNEYGNAVTLLQRA